MAAQQTTTTTAHNARLSAHLRPLDSVLCSLQDAICSKCQRLLTQLLIHLEEDIPAVEFEEVRKS